MLDYAMNTPEDGQRSAVCVEQRVDLIRKNLDLLNASGDPLLKAARC
jgi:hypothetical protein